jgi:N-acetyl-anhydromuramyl-L-alanine amidase AmpD
MFHERQHLLSVRNNPNSAVRANGFRWWGYPSRNSSITCIVLHTTENEPGNGVAMNVARWQASTAPAPSSYHKIVDTHNIIQTVSDNHTAFHAVGFNSRGLGVSFATRAVRWGQNAANDTRMLERGAWVVAQWCKLHNIPVRTITRTQGVNGVRGIITHAAVDPTRRSDPGANFPMARFLNLVRQYMDDRRDYITVGDVGPEVRSWQQDLQRWDSAALPIFGADSDFGDETRQWTLQFLDNQGLSVSDRSAPRVGPVTREAMQQALLKPEPQDEWEVFWMTLTDAEKKLAKEFFGYLAGPDGVENGASFARQFLVFNRTQRARLNKFVDDFEAARAKAKTSMQGIIVGGINVLDAVRSQGYSISTTERTGVRKTDETS